ncbi:cytochrome c oxidase assembly protein [Motiliproteus sp. SC1-56]|uniref:cytochrome c oxidase assembly protein n=1 Tax=Motiliproteus sp. SC1-56 TaxID=2799565 RepID=UPI001A8D6473
MAGAQNRRLITGLVAGSVAMFGFGFALVPLYDVFCRITGLNGKVEQGRERVEFIDAGRTVKVQLISSGSPGLRASLRPEVPTFQLHPGQLQETAFVVHNRSEEDRVIRAVPSVAPAEAVEFLNKIQCFCFEEQAVAAGEERRMPLAFTVSPRLPEHLHTLTLSYTLYDITPSKETGAAL